LRVHHIRQKFGPKKAAAKKVKKIPFFVPDAIHDELHITKDTEIRINQSTEFQIHNHVENIKKSTDFEISKHTRENITFGMEGLTTEWINPEGHEVIQLMHFTLFPSINLAVCTIPKAGSQSWRHMALIIQPHVSLKGTPKIIWANPKSQHVGRPRMKMIMKDETWIKVVFFRDPKERLLSGYLDKCVRQCCRMCPHFTNSTGPPSFQRFVHHLRMEGFHFNSHFLPQSWLCGNIATSLGLYDFIGLIDDPQEVYLQMMLLNEKYTVLQRSEFSSAVVQVYNRSGGTYKKHLRTDQTLDEYYTDSLTRQVDALYHDDYEMLQNLAQHPRSTEQLRKKFGIT